MRGTSCTGRNCTSEFHKYQGRRVGSLTTQWELEDLVRDLCKVFPHNGNDMVRAYVAHVRAQPKPRPRQAIYLVLGKDDVVDTRNPPWFVLPENKNLDKLPIDWHALEDMDAQLLVCIYVAGVVNGTPTNVKSQSMHMIDALMEDE